MENIIFRKMLVGEETEANILIEKVFNEFVAPGYSERGISEFKKYVTSNSLLSREKDGNFFIIAVHDKKFIGIIEIRNLNHISLFFVDKKHQEKGIGRILMKKAIDKCQAIDINIKTFSVNSSPYAKKVYEKLGFKQIQEEQSKNGLRFIPMSLIM